MKYFVKSPTHVKKIGHITKKDAEKIVRSIISKRAGEQMPENLFRDSVDQLMQEINGVEVH